MVDQEISGIEVLKTPETWPMWEMEMNVLFSSKELTEVVDGTEVINEGTDSEEKIRKWKTKDAKAKYFMLRTMDKTVKMHVLDCKTAKDMFDKLKKLYQRDSNQQKVNLLQEYYNYKYNKSINMLENISHIRNLVHKLEKLDQKIDEVMVLTKITSILPEEYMAFSSAWDSTPTSDKTLDNLVSRLIQEEGKLNKHKEESSIAFKVANNKIKNVTCYECHQKGHVKRDCPKLMKCAISKKIGHDQNKCFYKNKDTQKKCSICKKTNHEERNCYFRNKTKKGENNIAWLIKPEKINENEIFEEINKCETKKNLEFAVDSACTSHLVNDIEILKDIKEFEQSYRVAKSGTLLKSSVIGTVKGENCSLTNVSYISDLSRNLMSVNCITRKGGVVTFDNKGVKIFQENNLILEGEKQDNGLFIVDIGKVKINEVLISEKEYMYDVWHRKLGHLNTEYMKKLPDICDGVPKILSKTEQSDLCIVCMEAKQVRQPFKTVRDRATRPLEIIHTDICGPIEPETHDGKSYFMTCLDDYTHFCVVYLLSNKNEAKDCLKNYINQSEAQLNLKVSKIRCDNGGEYMNKAFKQWCFDRGIILDNTIPYTPQLNGKAERLNRSLMEKGRALIFDSKMEKEMWGEAVRTAAYLLNRCPSSTVDKTPRELWTGKRPNLDRLQIFGSIAFAKNLRHLKKLDPRGKKYIMVGYAPNGYRLWDEDKKTVIIARDVMFEKYFPGKQKVVEVGPIVKEEINKEHFEEHETDGEEHETEPDMNILMENERDGEEEHNQYDERNAQEDLNTNNNHVEGRNIPYSLRERQTIKKPERFNDYVHSPDDDTEDEVLLTYKECMESEDKEKWVKAIEEEKESLKLNNTWEFVDEKEYNDREILTSKWVFKIKDGGKYKARLVVRGCQQKEGKLDYKDTFSPVVDTNALRLLLAVATEENMIVKTFDVKTAFLHGDLEDEIYMKVPEGYNVEGKICRLKKALYGLKQAPRQWNKKLTDFLKNQGMESLKTDRCIFKTKDKSIFMAIHVDDGVVFGHSEEEVDKLLKTLKKRFEMTIFDDPKLYLGMELKKTKDGIFVSQNKYANQVLEKYNMIESHKKDTPITPTSGFQGNEPNKNFPYREAIGSLLYLTTKTRPDLSYAVNYESRFMENPREIDVQNVKRSLRYLKGTMDLGIHYKKSGSNEIHIDAYCDSDYAGDEETRKSTTGYVIFCSGGPIVWNSSKQSVTAKSSTEAEFIAAAECCAELKFIKYMLKEITNKEVKITLNIDSQSAMKIIKSGQMSGKRRKHIDVRFYFINEQYEDGLFEMQYCNTDDQIADVLTKPLMSVKFNKFKDMLVTKV